LLLPPEHPTTNFRRAMRPELVDARAPSPKAVINDTICPPDRLAF
jgi:hypothetical protein